MVTHIQYLFKRQYNQFKVFGKISFSVKYENEKIEISEKGLFYILKIKSTKEKIYMLPLLKMEL